MLLLAAFVFQVVSASGMEPGPAALEFLEKVRSGKVDMRPGGDTALQSNTSQGKQMEIKQAIERLRVDLRQGNLVVSGVKQEGDFAAVMVGNIISHGDGRVQMFPVAMVREGEKWRAAPVLASFENSVSAYTISLRKRLVSLENWMMRERVVGLEKLMSESATRMRAEIVKSMDGADLTGRDAEKVVEGFLKACAAGNEFALLGYLGGLSDPLPADWAQSLAAVRRAVDEKSREEQPWRLLVSDVVIREIVNVDLDKEGGVISVGCLDPVSGGAIQGRARIDMVHLSVSRDSKGTWRVELPIGFLEGERSKNDFDGDLDLDLQMNFLTKLRKEDPVVESKTQDEAESSFLKALKGRSLREVLRRVSFNGKEDEARRAAMLATEMWWSLNEDGQIIPLNLGVRRGDDETAVAYQWFSLRKPEVFDLRVLTFKDTKQGWLYDPNIGASPKEPNTKEWVDQNLEHWQNSWVEALEEKSVGLEKLPEGDLPDTKEAEKLAKAWVEALNQRDVVAALELTAWLDNDGKFSPRVCRNLGYDLSSAGRAKAVFTKIYRSEKWVCAGITFKNEQDFSRDALLPLVMTPKGVRVLSEIDLLAGNNRSRVFLNKGSLTRLGKFAGEESAEDLRKIFEKFEAEVE